MSGDVGQSVSVRGTLAARLRHRTVLGMLNPVFFRAVKLA
jgi:hypothetical protein